MSDTDEAEIYKVYRVGLILLSDIWCRLDSPPVRGMSPLHAVCSQDPTRRSVDGAYIVYAGSKTSCTYVHMAAKRTT